MGLSTCNFLYWIIKIDFQNTKKNKVNSTTTMAKRSVLSDGHILGPGRIYNIAQSTPYFEVYFSFL